MRVLSLARVLGGIHIKKQRRRRNNLKKNFHNFLGHVQLLGLRKFTTLLKDSGHAMGVYARSSSHIKSDTSKVFVTLQATVSSPLVPL